MKLRLYRNIHHISLYTFFNENQPLAWLLWPLGVSIDVQWVELKKMAYTANLYHIPQIPNLWQAILRTVQGLHWILWYKRDRAWFVRLYGR